MKGTAFHDKAKELLNRALPIAEKLNNPHVEIEVLSSLRILYNEMGEPKKAISYIRRELMLQKDTAQLYGIYLSLGDAYYKSSQNDSAVYYAYKSLSSPSFYTKANACIIFEDVARKKGDFAEALHFKDKYEAYMDSTKHIERTKELLAVEEETLLQQSEQKHRGNLSLYSYYLYVGGSFMITLIIIFAYKRIKYRQKTQQLKLEQESLLQTISTQSIQMKKDMENKDAEIAELSQKCSEYNEDKQYLDLLNSCLNELLKEKDKICIDMENAIADKEKAIEQLMKQIQISDEARHNIHLAEQLTNIKKEKCYLFDSLLSSRSVAYKTLLTMKQHNYENPDANEKVPNEIWETLISEIDQLTHGFTGRLTEKYERLLKEDVYFCCLVKIGMKYADIANVFGCTSNAAYKRRDAIMKRMNAETPIKFDILIEEI
jgi:tetratricopeptide repeat protein